MNNRIILCVTTLILLIFIVFYVFKIGNCSEKYKELKSKIDANINFNNDLNNQIDILTKKNNEKRILRKNRLDEFKQSELYNLNDNNNSKDIINIDDKVVYIPEPIQRNNNNSKDTINIDETVVYVPDPIQRKSNSNINTELYYNHNTDSVSLQKEDDVSFNEKIHPFNEYLEQFDGCVNGQKHNQKIPPPTTQSSQTDKPKQEVLFTVSRKHDPYSPSGGGACQFKSTPLPISTPAPKSGSNNNKCGSRQNSTSEDGGLPGGHIVSTPAPFSSHDGNGSCSDLPSTKSPNHSEQCTTPSTISPYSTRSPEQEGNCSHPHSTKSPNNSNQCNTPSSKSPYSTRSPEQEGNCSHPHSTPLPNDSHIKSTPQPLEGKCGDKSNEYPSSTAHPMNNSHCHSESDGNRHGNGNKVNSNHCGTDSGRTHHNTRQPNSIAHQEDRCLGNNYNQSNKPFTTHSPITSETCNGTLGNDSFKSTYAPIQSEDNTHGLVNCEHSKSSTPSPSKFITISNDLYECKKREVLSEDQYENNQKGPNGSCNNGFANYKGNFKKYNQNIDDDSVDYQGNLPTTTYKPDCDRPHIKAEEMISPESEATPSRNVRDPLQGTDYILSTSGEAIDLYQNNN